MVRNLSMFFIISVCLVDSMDKPIGPLLSCYSSQLFALTGFSGEIHPEKGGN